MRTRTILLVVAILLVAGFAALNWSEIVHTAPLSFGLMVTYAPLGLILLVLLGITLVLFLASTAAIRTQSLMEYRQHQKTLEAQRELAEKAEASRFTDLRGSLDQHLKAMRERDAIAASEFDKAMMQSRREMQQQMEQMNRMISSRLNEIEQRLTGRVTATPTAPLRTEVPPVMEHPAAEVRAEEREIRREERAAAADKPAESGWRKWF